MSLFNHFLLDKNIFLDHASATPLLKKAEKAMRKYWSESFYNPSAIYAGGLEVRKDVDEYRTRLARLLGVTKSSVIFTSGGTEADNLAIRGVLDAYKEKEKRVPHLIISAVEHPAIREIADKFQREGGEVSVLPVDEYGLVDPLHVKKALKTNTALVSIMLANNETGTLQDIAKIGRLLQEDKKKRESEYPYLHTDASQAPSYVDVDMLKLRVDLLTLDASKVYGPKGIGALVVRGKVPLRPLILGGGQEGGLRSGTLSPALIAGFVTAFEEVSHDRDKESLRLRALQKILIEGLSNLDSRVVVNTPLEKSLPNFVSVSVRGELGEVLVLKLERQGVLASVGSACSSDGKVSGSPVIQALGKRDLMESTVRLSMGRGTKEKDVSKVIEVFSSLLMHDNI